MFAEERKFEIIEYMRRKKKATVHELCERFNVSSTTIRTDLHDLEIHGVLIRTHGGAMLKTKTGLDLDLQSKKSQNIEAKQQIARLAIDMVEEGDTIVVDTGSTTQEFAKLLGRKQNITVVTNDLLIGLLCTEFQGIDAILLGGALRSDYHCTLDETSRDMLAELAADKAFMGTTGFTLKKGATVPDINHARLKRQMVEIAEMAFLLTDSTKFGRNSFAQYASPDMIDAVITEDANEYVLRELETTEIEVISP